MCEKEQLALEHNSYGFTEELLRIHGIDENFVFSPYALQHLLGSVAEHARISGEIPSNMRLGKSLRGIQFNNTTTGRLILLDKKLASAGSEAGAEDICAVSYPDEARRVKADFQQGILGTVMDGSVPQGHLNFYTAAHYFAKWEKTFDEELTEQRPFVLGNGEKISTMTMHNKFTSSDRTKGPVAKNSRYADEKSVSSSGNGVVRIPFLNLFGGGGTEVACGKITSEYEMAMLKGEQEAQVYFIKPLVSPYTVVANLEAIIHDFGDFGDFWDFIFEMPKLSIKNHLDLKPLLSALGLSGIVDEPLCFPDITGDIPYQASDVSQLTSLDINEKFAEARAFSAMCLGIVGYKPILQFQYIHMDHPYFIVIKDRNSRGDDNVVFTAWIADPR